MTIKAITILKEICSNALVLLFVYAASAKLLDFDNYVIAMRSQPFDDRLTYVFVWGIPTIELITVALLMLKKTKRLGFKVSAIMMSAFTIYIAVILTKLFGRIPCSCGGVINHLSWKEHLYFNLIFLAFALGGILLTKPGPPAKTAETNFSYL